MKEKNKINYTFFCICKEVDLPIELIQIGNDVL